MRRRRFLGLTTGLAASAAIAQAPPRKRLPRVGVVAGVSVAEFRGAQGRWPHVERGLRERGWIEGQNLEIHIRSSEGDVSRAERVVQEMIALPVDVLVPFGGIAQAAALRLVKTIPIVSVFGGYRGGYRRDLDPPLPPNVTGINFMPADAPSEPLAISLLKAIKPSISRVAFVGSPGTPAGLNQSEVVAAARIGITLSVTNVKSIHHPQADLDQALREGAEALMAYPGTDAPPIHDWARRHRVPVLYFFLGAAESGGLMALGVDRGSQIDRIAYFIDRILRGAKPRDLPVEDLGAQLIINLGAAEAIGLTVPVELQLRATKLIR